MTSVQKVFLVVIASLVALLVVGAQVVAGAETQVTMSFSGCNASPTSTHCQAPISPNFCNNIGCQSINCVGNAIQGSTGFQGPVNCTTDNGVQLTACTGVINPSSAGTVIPFSCTLSSTPTDTQITSAVDGNGNAVQNGGSTASTSITFQVTATAGSNPIAGYQCSLDGSTFSSCATTSPATISQNNLATGQHTFAVRAVDTQGNVDPTPATFSWTIITPNQATHTTMTSGLQVGTNTHQKQECKTTGGTSPVSASCNAASTNRIIQSGGIHDAPSTISLF